MQTKFYILERETFGKLFNTCTLIADSWDDYHYKTSFSLVYHDNQGIQVPIGVLKIGKLNAPLGWMKDSLQKDFDHLDDVFFSLGQDEGYYKSIRKLPKEIGNQILISLRDVVFQPGILQNINSELVFKISLLRFVSVTSILGQFSRILEYKAHLTEFNFSFARNQSDKVSKIDLSFSVNPDSKPVSNINVLIGRNGVGKTTIFNGIVKSVISPERSLPDDGVLIDSIGLKISPHFFSSIVSISFSAFDPFIPPPNRVDKSQGTSYYHVGLKKNGIGQKANTLKNHEELGRDIINSILASFSIPSKKERWLQCVKVLESDINFQEMNLGQLTLIEDEQRFWPVSSSLISRMSSGHMIVLLMISKLVEYVEEKTLVLIDEPESHLHPPLLSALIRTISELLIEKNAVALIATHSPVVLQEVPKQSVWILSRMQQFGQSYRPDIDTFGENVGTLTQLVFGLEVSKSGFYDLLSKEVEAGKDYQKILEEYQHQIGFEGRALLKTLIMNKSARN